MTLKNKPSGFTIVELLIVIVIIGIVAAITIATYNGVQSRASATQNITVAKSFGDALTRYVIENRAYPPGTSGYFCLGEYPSDVNNDGFTDCKYKGSTAHIWRNPTFDNALKPYLNINTKAGAYKSIDADGATLMGVQMWFDASLSLNGQSYPYLMYYVLPPGSTCSYGRLLKEDNWPNHTYTSSSERYTYSDPGGVGCLIALIDPRKS